MSNQKFFICKVCGNFVGLIKNAGAPMTCCGQEMEELIPNTVDASTEKHIPKVEAKGRLVYAEIGSVPHPTEDAHHIEFLYLQTQNGGQRRSIKVGDKPAVMFAVMNDIPLEVYAYCNIHGLWKADVMCECGSGKKMVDCNCINEDDHTEHNHGEHSHNEHCHGEHKHDKHCHGEHKHNEHCHGEHKHNEHCHGEHKHD